MKLVNDKGEVFKIEASLLAYAIGMARSDMRQRVNDASSVKDHAEYSRLYNCLNDALDFVNEE